MAFKDLKVKVSNALGREPREIETKVELDKTYVDKLTGFEGVAIVVQFHHFGCVHVELEATKLSDEGKRQIHIFDEQRLVEKSTMKPPKPQATSGAAHKPLQSPKPTSSARR